MSSTSNETMSGVAQGQQFISVEDYLEGERRSEVRHEYTGGQVYAMTGGSDDHNRIVTNKKLL
jgi:Uma2 family endonuclease